MKPIVHYTPNINQHIVVGNRAIVWPIDHTSPLVSNTQYCCTSKVLSIEADESFETLNSRYIPVKGGE